MFFSHLPSWHMQATLTNMHCYCKGCQATKSPEHICKCKCCNNVSQVLAECSKCLRYVCQNTCSQLLPSASGTVLHCSDCNAAATALPPFMVMDIVDQELLSDEHITRASVLLKNQFGDTIDGLSTPLPVLVGNAIDKDNFDFYPTFLLGKDYIQILNTGRNHWVTVIIRKGSRTVYVMDSSRHTTLSGLTQIQIAMILKTSESCIEIRRPYCKQQSNARDCGLFAVAHAIQFAHSQDIAFVDFDDNFLRDHFYNSLKEEFLTPFPLLSSRKKKIKYDDEPMMVKVYCVCKLPEFISNMCKCDRCKKFFHLICVNVDEKKLKRMKEWICEMCQKSSSSSVS